MVICADLVEAKGSLAMVMDDGIYHGRLIPSLTMTATQTQTTNLTGVRQKPINNGSHSKKQCGGRDILHPTTNKDGESPEPEPVKILSHQIQ